MEQPGQERRSNEEVTRRGFLKGAAEGAGKILLGAAALSWLEGCASTPGQARGTGPLHEISFKECEACGSCAAACVRKPLPAIQAYNDLSKCGYCLRCSAYFVKPEDASEAPENLVCKYGAFKRKKISEIRYKYWVDTRKCIGCGACVKICKKNGQKSISLRVNKKTCLHCDVCAAKESCKTGAFRTV
jgi:ferredoxin